MEHGRDAYLPPETMHVLQGVRKIMYFLRHMLTSLFEGLEPRSWALKLGQLSRFDMQLSDFGWYLWFRYNPTLSKDYDFSL